MTKETYVVGVWKFSENSHKTELTVSSRKWDWIYNVGGKLFCHWMLCSLNCLPCVGIISVILKRNLKWQMRILKWLWTFTSFICWNHYIFGGQPSDINENFFQLRRQFHFLHSLNSNFAKSESNLYTQESFDISPSSHYPSWPLVWILDRLY